MYVEIHASNAEKRSSGKSTRVDSERPKMQVLGMSPEHPCRSSWCIEVTAQEYIEYSSGAHGGEARVTKRTLKLHISPADLDELLTLAQANGLLKLTVRSEAGGLAAKND